MIPLAPEAAAVRPTAVPAAAPSATALEAGEDDVGRGIDVLGDVRLDVQQTCLRDVQSVLFLLCENDRRQTAQLLSLRPIRQASARSDARRPGAPSCMAADEALAFSALAARSRLCAQLMGEAMSDVVGPGDLVLCVNAAPNHFTGEAVPLVAGETYQIAAVLPFACPCGRSDALLDIGIDFAWCQSRFRLLPKPKSQTATRPATARKEKDTVR